jgi:hypothetical protein
MPNCRNFEEKTTTMDLTELTKLVTLIMAISVAGERLVTFVKTLVPWLSSPQVTVPTNDSTKEIIRKVIVMVIAFLSCWLTAYLANTDSIIKPWLLGLLASGGSAFWTNILTYLKGVSDVKKQAGLQEKINTVNALADSQGNKAARQEDLALQRLTGSPQPPFKS